MKRFKSIFDKVNLSDKERDFWLSRLDSVPSEQKEQILDLFEIFPGDISWFTDIQIRKEEALLKRDTNLWQKIIEEEKKFFSNKKI